MRKWTVDFRWISPSDHADQRHIVEALDELQAVYSAMCKVSKSTPRDVHPRVLGCDEFRVHVIEIQYERDAS